MHNLVPHLVLGKQQHARQHLAQVDNPRLTLGFLEGDQEFLVEIILLGVSVPMRVRRYQANLFEGFYGPLFREHSIFGSGP